ncbi:MAG: DsrH/TusB family sulfur metabolism protein, partial [Candidatus Bathyarchaeota archaeon]|nr:DsrH/TusB family sulfur metabolism protein [Candidatus Bathyarchaeota archaeon]
MRKLLVLKEEETDALKWANRLREKGEDVGLILMLDAVYLAKSSGENASVMKEIIEAGVEVFTLRRDAEKRGLIKMLQPGVKLVDYDDLVDIIF